MHRGVALSLLSAVLATPAWAINGNLLPLNSGGTLGSSVNLTHNGYAGTYIRVDTPGDVSVTVNASGSAAGGVNPWMNISIADTKAGFDVTPASSNPYSHVFEDLPVGTYFVRTDFPNNGGTGRSLSINSLDVSGATMLNSTNGTTLRSNALAAADTYIEHFRQGPTSVGLVGVAPGTEVHVKLKRHAFNWGTNIHGFNDSGLINPSPAPGSTAAKYQDFVVENFTMVEGSNAGKWTANEPTRDNVNMDWQDKIFTFAETHDMDVRMHTLVWGGSQEPAWVTNMLNNPGATDSYNAGSNPHGTNLSNLNAVFSDQIALGGTPNAGEQSEIHERIDYYVSQRAHRYTELDVYNESYHTGVNGGASSIWNRYGPAGVAKIYDEAAAAAHAVNPDVRLYLNEYSVLEAQDGDAYANWYRGNIEAVEFADGDPFDNTVGGIGIQYYSHGGHNPHTMMRALQNMMVLDLPITLTEFGVQGSVTDDDDRIRNMEESHRMLFGTPNATAFLYWGWWASATDPNLQGGGVLVDADFNLTPVGEAWRALRDSWITEETLFVDANGTIDFTGFYGDYEITIDDVTYDLLLEKGDTLQSLVVAPGDYNADGVVDAADYTVWRNTLDAPGDLRADGNGDEVVDLADYVVWKSFYGTVYGSGSGGIAANVPEPASVGLLLLGLGIALARRRTRAT